MVLVNDDRWGGSGLNFAATISLGNRDPATVPPGGNVFNITATLGPALHDHDPVSARNDWNRMADIVAHEMGHSYFNLADEYAWLMTAGAAGVATVEPNVASATDAGAPAWNTIKWDRLQYAGGPDMISAAVKAHIAAHGPLVNNPVCGGPNPGTIQTPMRPPAALGAGMLYPWQLIGLYEGGRAEHCGIYRPAGYCKMRALGHWWSHAAEYRDVAFCYVCRWEIINRIDPTLLPLLRLRQSPR